MKLFSVAIPRKLRGFPAVAPETQAFDVTIDDWYVTAINAVPTPPMGTLVSCFVDAHVHLDKTFRVDEIGAAHGDLQAAIDRTAAHSGTWDADEIELRMDRALFQAYAAGTRAMRTHLDWPGPKPPAALEVFIDVRYNWESRIELQFASLTPLDVLAGPDGQAIAEEVARAGGALGAFIYRNEGLEEKVEKVFNLAARNSVPLDFHVDEGLHADARGLRAVAARAQGRGWHGRVMCAHACSLSMQPREEAEATLALCAGAGLHLVSLPTTNLYLQGAWDGTPVERGITRLREAAAQGVSVCLATDNVADAFYPYGSYDILETFGLGVQAGHLPSPVDWLDSVTINPAKAMGLEWDGLIRPGCLADVVLLAARSEHELLSPEGRKRRVFRRGFEQ
ncbi:MAG: amidohydrolase family protein [Pseudomonadota bacterium]